MDSMDQSGGFVRVTFMDGGWKTAAGDSVPWYDVQTDLLTAEEVEAAVLRVLSVYGVSDVVVDAFDQLRKELRRPAPAPPPPQAE
jgi:hypothetical protein